MRYELTDHEWAAIKPMLPNKPCGVAWVNDRHAFGCSGPTGIAHEVQRPRRPRSVELIHQCVFVGEAIEA
jgi:hypothetical protein